MIEEKTTVPKDRQRLIYKAKLLADEQPLSNYSKDISSNYIFLVKENGETLHLVKKPVDQPATSNLP